MKCIEIAMSQNYDVFKIKISQILFSFLFCLILKISHICFISVFFLYFFSLWLMVTFNFRDLRYDFPHILFLNVLILYLLLRTIFSHIQYFSFFIFTTFFPAYTLYSFVSFSKFLATFLLNDIKGYTYNSSVQ